MTQQTSTTPFSGATLMATRKDGILHLAIRGNLDGQGTASIWEEAVSMIRNGEHGPVTADCEAIERMDGTGLALLLTLREETALRGDHLTIENLREEYQRLIDMTWECELPRWTPANAKERRGFARFVGEATSHILDDIKEMVTFVGEATAMCLAVLVRPRIVRWKDVLLSCITIGVDSLFIITLIGFLMGLIMSFQSAVSLQKFGGEIFVPNMLGLVMFREMGPLVTAILLAARSGSAFAAEIGTMKINEELDALVTMGLSPMRFMVLPKLLGTIFMVPLMIIFFNMASLVGGAVVMLSLGYPLVTFTSRVFAYTHYGDFVGGMFKGVIFAMLVAGIGCLRGLQTRSGASAVGHSTTSAVVSGIILIAFADGIFAMAFYFLGW